MVGRKDVTHAATDKCVYALRIVNRAAIQEMLSMAYGLKAVESAWFRAWGWAWRRVRLRRSAHGWEGTDRGLVLAAYQRAGWCFEKCVTTDCPVGPSRIRSVVDSTNLRPASLFGLLIMSCIADEISLLERTLLAGTDSWLSWCPHACWVAACNDECRRLLTCLQASRQCRPS